MCGREFFKPLSPAQIRLNEGKYCSRECSAIARRKIVNPGLCQRCGESIRRSATERPGKFSAKRYCGIVCSRAAEREKHDLRRRQAQKTCVVCGKTFIKSTLQQQKLRKCCSMSCARVLQGQRKADRISRLRCRVCGGPPKGYRFGEGGSCSRACGQKLRQAKALTRREESCKTCGKSFRSKQHQNGAWMKYCSMKCWRVVNAHRPQVKAVICDNCGCEFRRTFGAVKRSKRLFCSKECQHKYMAGANTAAWRGGSDPNRGRGWVKLAELIRERDGHRCQRCNRTQEENRQKLSVDHIKPWRLFDSAEAANHPTNLISLCRKCHTWKTHVAETRMLKGDNIQFQQYKQSIQLPPLLAMGVSK